MEKELLLDEITERIGILLNSLDAKEDLRKLVILELSTNQEAQSLDLDEVLGIVVKRLIAFYKSQELEDLWTQFVLYEGAEAIEKLMAIDLKAS